MTFSKIIGLADIEVCVNDSPIPGILSVEEGFTADIHRIEAFGEKSPVAVITGDKCYSIKLTLLEQGDANDILPETDFTVSIAKAGIDRVSYHNCKVSKAVRRTDEKNRIVTDLTVISDTKTKDVI